MNGKGCWGAALILMLVGWSGTALAGSTTWESVFESTPSSLASAGVGPDLWSANGHVYLSSKLPGPQIAKVDTTTGTVAWSATSGPALGADRLIVLPLADGGAISLGNSVARHDPDGTERWRTSAPGTNFFAGMTAPGNVLVASRRGSGVRYTTFSVTDGRMLETLDVDRAGSGGCYPIQLSTTSAAAFVLNRCADSGSELVRISDGPLRVDWSFAGELSGGFALGSSAWMRTGNDAVYVSNAGALARVSPATGAVIWRVDGLGSAAMRHAGDGDIVLRRPGVLELRRSVDGSLVWTREWTDTINAVDGSGSRLVIAGESGAGIGYIANVDALDGVVQWRRDADLAGSQSSRVAALAIDNDSVIAVGSACRPWEQGGNCVARIWRTSLTGSAAVTDGAVVVAQDVSGVARSDGGLHTLVAAIEPVGERVQIRVRRLRNADGVVEWEAIVPSDELPPTVNSVQMRRGGDGHVVVSAVRGTNAYNSASITSASIYKLDAVSGSVTWTQRNIDLDVNYIVVAPLAVDALGNVFLGAHETFRSGSQPIGQPMQRRSVRKLDATTGEMVWRHVFPECPASLCPAPSSPPRVEAVGTDVIVYEVPPQSAVYLFKWTRLNGGNGDVMWASPTLVGGFDRLDADHALASISTNGQLNLHRVDLSTGNIIGSVSYSHPGDSGYSIGSVLQRADGVVFASGLRASSGLGYYAALMLRIASGGNVIDWAQRALPNPISPEGRSMGLSMLDASSVYVSHAHAIVSPQGSERFLTRVDAQSGAFTGSRFWERMQLGQPGRTFDNSGHARFAEGLPSIVTSQRYRPGRSSVLRIVAMPAVDQSVAGALSVDLAVDWTSGSQGRPFVFTTRNTGSTMASDVEAMLEIPSNAHLQSLTCFIDGAPCTPVTTATLLSLTGDLPAGAQLVIAGTLHRVPGNSDNPVMYASSFASFGFSELDMNDNRVSIQPWDVLFASGFD